jgi:hypothetical protein
MAPEKSFQIELFQIKKTDQFVPVCFRSVHFDTDPDPRIRSRASD